MEELSQSKPNTFPTNPNFKLKGIIIPFLILLAGIAIGYSANRFLSLQTKMIAETNLPIGSALLQNPIVYQWSGSVEGSLLRKDEQSLTLSKDGNIITIPVSRATVFVNPVASSSASNKISLKDIPIGSYLRGVFFANPQPQDKNMIQGGHFIIEKPR